MRIYFAARYSRRLELGGYKVDAERLGHRVEARWLAGRGPRAGPPDGAFARELFEDLVAADLCLSFTEGPGPHDRDGVRQVELGIALGRGILCWIVGPRENIFHTLPFVRRFECWDHALVGLAANIVG